MSAGTASAGRTAGWGVLAAACVSTLVVNANTSAVTILLPAISKDVGTSVDTLQWAVTGYSLVGAAVIVTSGALGDVFGRRLFFIAGLVLFVASCVLIALSTNGTGVIGGRMIQGAAGATILACGMSLLSVESSGAAQMKAITMWGAASAAGAAAGPLVGGVLVELTGWQGLFWIDAAIAALCIPLTLLTVRESRDVNRSRSIDFAGTVLIAAILVPLLLAFSEGSNWGWTSFAVIGCFVISALSVVAFVLVEQRVTAPLVDLSLLRNAVLVGATLSILIVAGAINALMYVLSLYFQDPAGFGYSALVTGLATLPAAAVMIAITPFITPIAMRVGSLRAVAIGFLLTTAAFAILVFVTDSWTYAAFVGPLVLMAIGLGLANGPASSASTSSVSADQVGQASGISNMARYIGGSLVVAIIATIYNNAITNHLNAGESRSQALAAGVSRSAFALAVISFLGVVLARLLRRHRATAPRSVDLAQAAAVTTHTIPIPEAT
ncbi:MAG TPA: MFS transporter [Gaiellaceae bacterium]|jgi:EmrB/QacA subfamily drug resistance transporter|nr:MFS transporter [Gaiellaceae bacterium]